MERDRAIEQAISQIEKQFGRGSIMKLGDESFLDIPSISTGSLALHIGAEAQAKGGMVAFIDAEHALDVTYARKLGVDVDSLLVSQPDTGEQALDIAEILVRSGGIDVLIIDSVAALVPKAEIEGEMGDHHVGLQARLMSQALRKLTASISKSRTCVVFINQIRMKIGVMFGNPETTTGGNALKFYASQRLDIRRIGAIKEGDQTIGNRTRVKVVKNKVAPPFKEAEFDIVYGEGISKDGDILDMGASLGIIEKSGAWYSFGEDRIGQGRQNVKRFLAENRDIRDKIADLIRERTGLKKVGDVKEAVTEQGI
jgi:recombination protein RecA